MKNAQDEGLKLQTTDIAASAVVIRQTTRKLTTDSSTTS
jgi:hypothetical protein